MTVSADVAPGARLVLPAWTPGSYMIRDYVHHLQRIEATDAGGRPLDLAPDGVAAWHLPAGAAGPVTVTLELYADEPTVRTNHVDDHHALLVPPATFPYVDGARDRPHAVTIDAPDDEVFALLPRAADGSFLADDYDHLVDSAFEVGRLTWTAFDVAGVGHRFVWAGPGTVDLARLRDDTRAVADAAVALFDGDLPAASYTFLCVGAPDDNTGGGLEHRDGATLMVPPRAFTDQDRYGRVQGLVAHEYLHLWNGRRLAPRALVRPDYERPNPTPSLWVAEGWTTYYGTLLPRRASLWSQETFLDQLADQWTAVMDTPGVALQSVREASYRAWTHYYVRDHNSPNAGTDYYRHGAVLAWTLDLLIRQEQAEGDGLDDALRLLWRRFARSADGYTEDDVEAAVAEAAGRDLAAVFNRHVGGRALPPLEDLVGTVGLRLVRDNRREQPPDLGVRTTSRDGDVVVTAVLRDRPAWRAGLAGGDRLLAIDAVRVNAGQLDAALAGYRPGDTVTVAAVSGARHIHRAVTLGEPRPGWRLLVDEAADDRQRARFRRWTGHALD